MLDCAAYSTNLEELENKVYRGPIALASVRLLILQVEILKS